MTFWYPLVNQHRGSKPDFLLLLSWSMSWYQKTEPRPQAEPAENMQVKILLPKHFLHPLDKSSKPDLRKFLEISSQGKVGIVTFYVEVLQDVRKCFCFSQNFLQREFHIRWNWEWKEMCRENEYGLLLATFSCTYEAYLSNQSSRGCWCLHSSDHISTAEGNTLFFYNLIPLRCSFYIMGSLTCLRRSSVANVQLIVLAKNKRQRKKHGNVLKFCFKKRMQTHTPWETVR